ncbi:MAG: hypothetical protein ACREFD_09320 [Stellaceae bacterium]
MQNPTGLAVIMGTDRPFYDTYMQVGGDGLSIKAATLRAHLKESATLQQSLLRNGHSLVVPMTQTAVANDATTSKSVLPAGC